LGFGLGFLPPFRRRNKPINNGNRRKKQKGQKRAETPINKEIEAKTPNVNNFLENGLKQRY